MFALFGVAVVALGFLLRAHPLLVILAAAAASGLGAVWTPDTEPEALLAAGADTLRTFGRAFNDSRYISVVWIVLAAIGLLERSGLQEEARRLIVTIRTASAGRLLTVYLMIRQGAAALGLTSLGGHAQMVRPLIAPMAEAAAETQLGDLSDRQRMLIRAHAAGADNIGLFFGEDIFIAIGSILLMVGFLEQSGIIVEPLALSIYAIPTAIAALLVHGTRLTLLDRRLSALGGAESGSSLR
jgi:uncharacterized membrane protein